jgi:hypothetical protein
MGKFFDMIHEKAHSTWMGGKIDKANFDEWVEHWFASAESIHDTFVREGLTDTAAYMRTMIDDTKAWRYKDKK